MRNLYIVIKVDNLSIFEVFLENEDDIDEIIVDGQNILYLVVYYGSYLICNFILKYYKKLFFCVDN